MSFEMLMIFFLLSNNKYTLTEKLVLFSVFINNIRKDLPTVKMHIFVDDTVIYYLVTS